MLPGGGCHYIIACPFSPVKGVFIPVGAFSRSVMETGVVGTPRVSPDARHSPDHRPRENGPHPPNPLPAKRIGEGG